MRDARCIDDATPEELKDPYIRICFAAKVSGRGVRLSWEECCDLSLDDAINTVAVNRMNPHHQEQAATNTSEESCDE